MLLHPSSNLCPSSFCMQIHSLPRLSSRSLHHAPLHSWKDASHLSYIIRSYAVLLALSEAEKKAKFCTISRYFRVLVTSPLGVSTTLAGYGPVWMSFYWTGISWLNLWRTRKQHTRFVLCLFSKRDIYASVSAWNPLQGLQGSQMDTDGYMQAHVSLRADLLSLPQTQKLDSKRHRLHWQLVTSQVFPSIHRHIRALKHMKSDFLP